MRVRRASCSQRGECSRIVDIDTAASTSTRGTATAKTTGTATPAALSTTALATATRTAALAAATATTATATALDWCEAGFDLDNLGLLLLGLSSGALLGLAGEEIGLVLLEHCSTAALQDAILIALVLADLASLELGNEGLESGGSLFLFLEPLVVGEGVVLLILEPGGPGRSLSLSGGLGFGSRRFSGTFSGGSVSGSSLLGHGSLLDRVGFAFDLGNLLGGTGVPAPALVDLLVGVGDARI